MNNPKKIYIVYIILCVFFSINVQAQNIQQISKDKKSELKKYIEIGKQAESQGDMNVAASSYNKCAFIYWKYGHLHDAVDQFVKSAVIYKKLENLINLKNIYTNIGVIYTDLQEVEMAEKYFKNSLEIARSIGKKKEIASSLIDLAYILSAVGKYDESNQKLDEAYKISQNLGNNELLLNCYGLFSENYRKMNQPEKAQQYKDKYSQTQQLQTKQSLESEFEGKEVKNLAEIQRTKIEKRAKELELKLKQIQLTSVKDSLSYSEQLAREKENKINLLKKDSAISALKIERQAIKEKEAQALIKQQEATRRTQRILLIATGIVLLLVIVSAISLYKRFKDKKRANKVLNERNIEIAEKGQELSSALEKIQKQNKQITKSINYAKGIQQAMLPTIEELNFYIQESFILFQPRDIVSGDFYWFRKAEKHFDIKKIFKKSNEAGLTELEDDDKFILAAVDCTGHGVPGAFMSMIGYNLLTDITDRGIDRPDIILEQLHYGIIASLKQHQTNNNDGMDMALCTIDFKNNKLYYAGAKNNLIYIQNNEVFQLKADKIPIGGTLINEPNFKLKELEIKQPTYCYIFSDGYIDQFGGPDGRKYMSKKFRNLILEIHKMPMHEQKEILQLTIEAWMGDNYTQIDDILIIGFKLDPNLKQIS